MYCLKEVFKSGLFAELNYNKIKFIFFLLISYIMVKHERIIVIPNIFEENINCNFIFDK